MVIRRKTLAQLRREIAMEKRTIAREGLTTKKLSERTMLKKELFMLKRRKLIATGEKAKRLSGRFGRGILKAGQKIAPVAKKQAKLIRQQQLRDDAIARRLSTRTTPKKRKRKVKRVSGPEKTRQVFVPGLGLVTQRIKPKKR